MFVVLGLPVILVGNSRGWAWVNSIWWRLAHLVAIAVVVLQSWLGQYCALTELESKLRQQAGQPTYERSFIEHWVQRSLYFEAPLWVFALVYTSFGALVAWAWWRYPPKVATAVRSDA
jgi:H+/Cl- antiporter ClcA